LTSEKVIINPPDKYDLFLIWMAFIGIVAVSFSLFVIFNTIFSLGGIIAGSTYIIADYYRQYVIKPESVAIQENGIVFRFRFRPDCYVPWDEVVGVYSNPGPEPNRLGKTTAAGGVKIRFNDNFKFYRVSYRISREIIVSYREVRGEEPDIWGGTLYIKSIERAMTLNLLAS
jgi:hypothetical protein